MRKVRYSEGVSAWADGKAELSSTEKGKNTGRGSRPRVPL